MDRISLLVNTGHFHRIPIESRLCKCNEVQTLEHVILQCPFTASLRDEAFPSNLHEFFANNALAAIKLKAMEVVLQVRPF